MPPGARTVLQSPAICQRPQGCGGRRVGYSTLECIDTDPLQVLPGQEWSYLDWIDFP